MITSASSRTVNAFLSVNVYIFTYKGGEEVASGELVHMESQLLSRLLVSTDSEGAPSTAASNTKVGG